MPLFSSDAFKGKHALVTGATGGIGRETATLLVEMGATVTATGRNRKKLESWREEIHKNHPDSTIHIVAADITQESDRMNLVTEAEKHNGKISLLVNNAGILETGKVETLTQEKMERLMHVNYTSTVLLTQNVYRKMAAENEGAVVHVSSLSGLRGTYGNAAYSASKFALIGFTHAMALEAIQHGVRVNAVCPGYVETEMGRQAIQNKADQFQRPFEEQWRLAQQSNPSGRITHAYEVANTIAFLLSDAAENIVGEAVKISGGAVLR